MIHLARMTEAEFQTYLNAAIDDYAQEKVKAGNWHPTEARQKSEASYQQLLPEGLASQNQYLFSITLTDAATDTATTVGMIWFAVQTDQPQPAAFIYDFIIQEPFRRRGYGQQALLAIEAQVQALGLKAIGLHVFGHNSGAIALYQKLGYEVTNLNMVKKLRG